MGVPQASSLKPQASPSHSARHRRLARGGFTILELLIVITIISVLLLLTVQVVGAFITQARDTATQTTIRKIQSLLNSRAEALHRLQKRPNYIVSSVDYNNSDVISLSGGTANPNVNRRKILAIKRMTKRYFPQRYEDVDTDLQPKIKAGDTSAEILYDFLTQSNALNDLIGADAFSTSEVADFDNDGLPEFIDAWGKPLRFYRWPTRLFRPAAGPATGDDVTATINVTNAKVLLSTLPSFSGNLSKDLARDPDDPLRMMVGISGFEEAFHNPATYHTYLVVSSGPDGVLGLYEPDDTANNGQLANVNPAKVDNLYDDITYLNTRAGGK
jgi:prepilin-type N-terminal cleavage/methylation domain-containing protein